MFDRKRLWRPFGVLKIVLCSDFKTWFTLTPWKDKWFTGSSLNSSSACDMLETMRQKLCIFSIGFIGNVVVYNLFFSLWPFIFSHGLSHLSCTSCNPTLYKCWYIKCLYLFDMLDFKFNAVWCKIYMLETIC